MALETGTYISDLVTTNPAGTDTLDKADDHLRLIKSTVKATFPNITGAVTPTQTDLNKLTSAGSPQFSTIELGAASDTTISRVSAGLIAVEGGNVPLENRANTFSANQIISVTDNTNAALRVTQLGTGLALRIEDETNPDTSPFVVDASGNVGIGTAAPGQKLDVTGTNVLALLSEAGATYNMSWRGFTGTSNYALRENGANRVGINFDCTNQRFEFYTANTERMRIDASGNVGIGTSSPTVGSRLDVNGGNVYNTTTATGLTGYVIYNGTNIGTNCSYDFNASNAYYDFHTRLFFRDAASGYATRLRIDSSGNILNISSGGLGYGTGSGGTVTQITSRSTGVTLNKTNGQITTHTASLAAGAEVSFVVTNSTVAATDTIIIHRASGGANGEIIAYIDAVAAGSFTVTCSNVSGSSTTSAYVLNFAVIKAVTA